MVYFFSRVSVGSTSQYCISSLLILILTHLEHFIFIYNRVNMLLVRETNEHTCPGRYENGWRREFRNYVQPKNISTLKKNSNAVRLVMTK